MIKFSQLAEQESKIMRLLSIKQYSEATEEVHNFITLLDSLEEGGSGKNIEIRQYKKYVSLYNLAAIFTK